MQGLLTSTDHANFCPLDIYLDNVHIFVSNYVIHTGQLDGDLRNSMACCVRAAGHK